MMVTEKRDDHLVDLRRKAEDIHSSQKAFNGKRIDQLSPEEIQQNIHELQVHQIELELQNEELLVAQNQLEQARERYRDLYDFAPVGYWLVNTKGLIAQSNLTACNLISTPRGKIVRQPVSSFILAEDQDIYYLSRKRLLNTGEPQECELRLKKEPDSFWARLILTSALSAKGESCIRIAINDISQRKKADDQLKISAVAFDAQNGMAITTPQGIIEKVNTGFTRITGYSSDEVVGQSMSILRSGRHDSAFYQKMWTTLTNQGSWKGEIWNKRKNGDIYPELLTITSIVSDQQQVSHYVASFTDITDDKEAVAEIHRLAYYDPLTKLPNRRLLQDRLGQAINAAQRNKQYGAIFFIDIDNFKALNDSRGHHIGDLLLIDIARRITKNIRNIDTVSRLGGDEFVVLVANLGSDPLQAAEIATSLGHKILTAVDLTPFVIKGYNYHCRISIGVSLFYNDDTVESLFKHADLALYKAKESGRNQMSFFDPQMQALLERDILMESELHEAIRNNQFELFFQPQVDTNRQIICAEVLIRWRHPARGLQPPDIFIPLAEHTDLILPIGLWVLQTACKQLQQWAENDNTRQLTISVNISARQFGQSGFVDQLKTVLATYKINPALLLLEVTESAVLEDIDASIQKMETLKNLGFKLSMDDFGTGYSSLSYLAQLPFNQIKIDRSFVRFLTQDTVSDNIAQAIIDLGKSLDMEVVAEGIETEEQWNFLRGLGCCVFQGYLFSPPLPIKQFSALLEAH